MAANIRLIATDLDGTLLDDSGTIPDAHLRALREAMRRGVHVTLSTGRMFSSASKFAAQVGVEIPLICYNGAMLRRPDGETLSHHPLDMEIALQLLAIFKSRDMYVQSYIDDVLYIKDPHDEEFQAYLKHFRINGQPVGDDLYRPVCAPTKLLAMTDGIAHSHELIAELSERFAGRLYITSSNSDFVEMMNPDVNKALGLQTLADSLGIPMCEVMALGDGENDVEMVSQAGVGIAMANGRDRLKAAADEIAPSNNENGLAWAVEKYVLKER